MSSSTAKLCASIELNTPAVLGGARPLQVDPYFKLRPSSVRGGLRYWFRAAAASMLWPERGSDATAQHHLDAKMVDALRKLEAYVFGDTERRSRVVVLPPEGGVVDTWQPMPHRDRDPGLRYLGYGLFDGKEGPPTRLQTRHGEPLQLHLHIRDPQPALVQVVIASLWLWTTFGGLGARGRRGYGSMQLVSLTSSDTRPVGELARLCNSVPKDAHEHLHRLQRGIGASQDSIKALVDLAKHGRDELHGNGQRPHPSIRTLDGIANLHALHGDAPVALDALEVAGTLMQRFRSSLKRKTPLPDYHAVKGSLTPPYRAPTTVDRAAFGLPLNFYFRSLNGLKTQFLPLRHGGDDQPDRLASPLLVRVHALEPRPGKRAYGVTLVNLAGRSTAKPLLGCDLRQGKDAKAIAAPTAKLLDGFIDWAVRTSQQEQSLQSARRAKRGRRP